MSKAVKTRLTILQKAFDLIYRQGFQATSIDEIIAKTEVSKGAFFYHFKNKDDMGLAMIKEVVYPGMYAAMVQPLLSAQEPADELYLMMKGLLLDNIFFQAKYGCPAINLIDEMAPLNDDFQKTLSGIVLRWQQAIEQCVENGKTAGKIRADVQETQVAYFIISGYGGIRNLGKVLGKACYPPYLSELRNYLKSLT